MPSLRLFISHTAAHNIFIEQHIVPLANRYFSDHFYSNFRSANATTYKEHILTGLTNCRWIVVTCAALRGVGRQEHTWAEYDPRRAFRLFAALEICHEEHGVIAGRKPGRMQVPG
jgi:hypothetical protein